MEIIGHETGDAPRGPPAVRLQKPATIGTIERDGTMQANPVPNAEFKMRNDLLPTPQPERRTLDVSVFVQTNRGRRIVQTREWSPLGARRATAGLCKERTTP